MLPKSALIGFALVTFASPLAADEQVCEPLGQNGMVALVLCPEGLSQEQWRDAGVAACGEILPCGAWIWDNPSDVPKTAPASHDKLPKAAVRSAKAIWVSEKKQLVILEKETN